MNRLFVFGLLLFGTYYMLKGGIGIVGDLGNNSAALAIRGMTETELNTRIIDHYKNDVLNGISNFTANAIDTTITDLNDDGKKDVIAIVDSGMTCSSSGCIASIFVENDIGELVAIPFEYQVMRIEVLKSLTKGMHDLKINEDANYKMIWDGATYVRE